MPQTSKNKMQTSAWGCRDQAHQSSAVRDNQPPQIKAPGTRLIVLGRATSAWLSLEPATPRAMGLASHPRWPFCSEELSPFCLWPLLPFTQATELRPVPL